MFILRTRYGKETGNLAHHCSKCGASSPLAPGLSRQMEYFEEKI